MIKANELRIGNLIYLKHGSLGYKIHPVSATLLFRRPKLDEILEKCGFEQQHTSYYLRRNIFYFTKPDLKFTIEDGDGNFNYPPCKYVHQLQNLYFALTGEELEVKL